MSQQLLTSAELSERLKVHPNTIRRWVREGLIPYLRLPELGNSGSIRYDLDAVLDAMRRNRRVFDAQAPKEGWR